MGRIDEDSLHFNTSLDLVKLWIVVQEVSVGSRSLCF